MVECVIYYFLQQRARTVSGATSAFDSLKIPDPVQEQLLDSRVVMKVDHNHVSGSNVSFATSSVATQIQNYSTSEEDNFEGRKEKFFQNLLR